MSGTLTIVVDDLAELPVEHSAVGGLEVVGQLEDLLLGQSNHILQRPGKHRQELAL